MATSVDRIRLLGLTLSEAESGRGRTTAELAWRGETYAGTSEASSSDEGRLRSAAQATTDAIGRVIGAEVATLELLDIETVNAFGTPAVIVALSVRTQKPEYFVGFCMVADDPAVAAAKSVLNATNRLVQRVMKPV